MFDLLNGIRVVDLTTVVLGPYATQMLGDLGADVIKVEPLGGDVFRYVRPGHSNDMGAGFLNCNRNKRSITLDLRHPDGRKILHDLVRQADVIVHNMRPKSADKLGIGFEELRAVKSDIIYCYAAGFGQGGDYADEPAYDDIIQAVSGLAYLNANAAGEPRFLPTIIADKVGGLHLALAVLAGLASRNRDGKALCIEAPMFESMVSFLMVEQLAGRSFDPPLGGIGYDRLLSPYRKPFATSDGFISILPYNGAHWVRFLGLIGRDDLADDDRVTDPVKRSRNIDMLYAIIEQATPERTTAEWVTLLKQQDIPCAYVNRVEDLLDNAHLQQVRMFRTIDHPSEGRLVSVRTPFSVDGACESEDHHAARLGADSAAILRDIGFGEDEIRALIETGVTTDAGKSMTGHGGDE